jgi:hypothetical protein
MADKKIDIEDKKLLLIDWIVNLDDDSIDELFEKYKKFWDYK